MPKIYENSDVLSRGVYMAFEGMNPHAGIRGRAWHYLIDRFQRDVRLPGTPLFDKYKGLEKLPNGEERPSGILFDEHPEDIAHYWQYHEVEGLVVPTLRTFVDGVNKTLDGARNQADRNRVIQSKLGPNVGIVVLSHLDRTADHFMSLPDRQA